MPTVTLNTIFHSTTDADLRTWGKAISDALASLGLVKTSDTGQINWATVTKPANNTAAGFEIWRFNDPLQATAPLFIKLEYGTQFSTGTAQNPGLWITLGKGSNGAGDLVDVLAPRRAAQGNTSASSAAPPTSIEPIYLSSDGSSLCFSARIGPTAATTLRAPAFVIDRSRDSAGNPTAAGGVILTEGSGVITATVSASGVVDAQMHAWTYRGESVMSSVPAVVPTMINGAALTDSTTLANGDRGLVFPYVAVVPGHDPWQILGACAVVAADAANGPFTANFLGRVRTFRSIPIGGSHNRWMTGSTGYSGLCILWEV